MTLTDWHIFKSSDPTRPAVLLFHGMGDSADSWMAPSNSPSGEFAYDYRHTPKDQRVGDTHAFPNVGPYKVSSSDKLYDDESKWNAEHNWFGQLKKNNFTVATWTQPGHGFYAAYASAVEAFETFLNATAPAPVALIGHSRGGLLIRKLLKERGSLGRVRWMVTLHSPHTGSEVAADPAKLVAAVGDLVDADPLGALVGPFKRELRDLVIDLCRAIIGTLIHQSLELAPDSRLELAPGSTLLLDLAHGETRLADVNYYTFGGVNPNYVRFYLCHYDAMSAVPQYKTKFKKVLGVRVPAGITQYFVWRTKAAEIFPVSPMLDKVPNLVPEIQSGQGDGVVADARSRLPFATHETTHLNHVETLWDRDLQVKVMNLLGGLILPPLRLPWRRAPR